MKVRHVPQGTSWHPATDNLMLVQASQTLLSLVLITALSLVLITALSLVESFIVLKYFYSVATPPLLCHKDMHAKCPRHAMRDILCLSLVLYGISIGGFHVRKGPIRSSFHFPL